MHKDLSSQQGIYRSLTKVNRVGAHWGYKNEMCNENVNAIQKKENKFQILKRQITYILTQNGITIPIHFKFFRVNHVDAVDGLLIWERYQGDCI